MTGQDKDQNKTILVTDDCAALRRMMSIVLEKNGYNVITARDGQEAVDMIQSYDIDAFLMDIDMPRMNGIEAVRNIRQDPKHTDTPVIFFTGEDTAERRQKASDAGGNSFMSKPVKLQTLIEQMASNLN